MSQYPPPPYGPQGPYAPPAVPQYPQYGYAYAPVDLLAPARRAAIALFIVGLFTVACGGVFFLALLVPDDDPAMQEQLSKIPGATVDLLKVLAGSCGGINLLLALALIVCSLFVRKGNIVAIVSALVLCGLVTVLSMLFGFATLFTNPAEILFFLIIVTVFGGLVVMLIQGFRSALVARSQASQAQQQWWQYQQQYYAQMAQQSGLGNSYAAQQQQPPSTPPPPSTDSSSP